MSTNEAQIEQALIVKLGDLKYTPRPDIRDRATLEANFREKFQQLNRVNLTDEEFARLLEEIVTPDVFTAAQTLRMRNSFIRADGTPLNYTLVSIDDWCKNSFEVVNQLRISTDYSHHRFDVILLINGVPVVQIELKTLGINPRRAIEQIVEYKNDPGNGFTRTLLCFMQVFIVSNRDSTYYFANNNARHFSFNADERFLPIYQFAAPDNSKINGLDEFADAFLAKCTLGQMISRYMVLVASEQKLLMMRPYLPRRTLSSHRVRHGCQASRARRFARPGRERLPGHHRVQAAQQRKRDQPGAVLSGLAARSQSRFPSAGHGQAGKGRGGPDRMERHPAAVHRGGLHSL